LASLNAVGVVRQLVNALMHANNVDEGRSTFEAPPLQQVSHILSTMRMPDIHLQVGPHVLRSYVYIQFSRHGWCELDRV
jgi:hypothetical protein